LTTEEQIENLLYEADNMGKRKDLIEKVHLHYSRNPKKSKLHYYEMYLNKMKINKNTN
jgi:hypothetical protein